jgi:hypothetical protein
MSTPPTDRLTVDLLSCVRRHGQCLDSAIAAEFAVPLQDVRSRLSALLPSGEVIACNITRFENGKTFEAVMYRASGYFPPPSPGRKRKAPAT